MEYWKTIPGFPLYSVSSSGKVKGPRGKNLRGRPKADGYLRVNLYNKSCVPITLSIHRLVLMAFRGASVLQSRHLNGIRTDNRLENLDYGTCEDQYKDKIAHGTNRYKLSTEAVAAIKHGRLLGVSAKELAGYFKVTKRHIYNVTKET